jgi:3-phenylpropionate/cinnamic acid dioxygenase small subunit
MDILWYEAALLDTDRQLEWLELLTDDIVYTMPVRKTVSRKDGSGIDSRGGGFSGGSFNFNDTLDDLKMRVNKNVVVEGAFDRDPPPRIRRVVSNVLVHTTEVPDEYRVDSYIVMLRNQYNLTDYDFLSGTRQDVLRKVGDDLRLARRTILLDMSTIGSAYPNVLLY